jgi:hypothetical protein
MEYIILGRHVRGLSSQLRGWICGCDSRRVLRVLRWLTIYNPSRAKICPRRQCTSDTICC